MSAVIIIMGVSGVGKTTIGKTLAQALQLSFIEGDDFHPESNTKKMASGQALTDEDRWPWLAALSEFVNTKDKVVVSCSALKESYRKFMSENVVQKITWVHLTLPDKILLQRLQTREDHFMPASLLQSQLATLEEPNPGESITVINAGNPTAIVEKIMTALKSEFGIIGLGVMGKSLARNFANQGIRLSLFNSHRPPAEINIAKDFQNEYLELSSAKPFDDLAEFVESLEAPRKILLMVQAGKVVDLFIDQLLPLLSPGDVLIDAGNSHFKDTEKRIKECAVSNIYFLGMGVSGGEKGALEGPSMMPAGPEPAYDMVQPMLEKIAAKDANNQPCCSYLGKGGAGHFIKMVHNGIEYGEMQLLAELGSFLQHKMQMTPEAIAQLLQEWNQEPLQSYLLEITGKIYQHQEAGELLLNKILDKAGNKGTGNWTTVAASELGIAIPGLTAALFARYLSALKKERQEMAEQYGVSSTTEFDPPSFSDLSVAYQAARLMNHRQGFALLQAASAEYDWSISLPEIARVWSNGCILRSALINDLSVDLRSEADLARHPKYIKLLTSSNNSFSRLCQTFLNTQHASPCWQANYQYFLMISEANSSANIIQAQRDFFGAHQYQRKDDPTQSFHHTNWE